MDAQEIIRRLGLVPHPTCGFVVETYRSASEIPRSGLPDDYEGPRPYGSALYFLVTPEARMVLHRIRSDQIYHHYSGDPLEVLVLRPGGRGEVVTLGPDLARGMRPQLLIPARSFHVSRLAPGGRFALLGTTAWPAVEASDVEFPDVERLTAEYPDLAGVIRGFARFPPPASMADFL